MSSQGNAVFDHARSKLWHSRSSILSPTLTTDRQQLNGWQNVPASYQPLVRAPVRVVNGYHLDRPLPRPPPRPRTTSPSPAHQPMTSLDMESLRNPTPRTNRRRSAQEAPTPWADRPDDEPDNRNKRTNVNLAMALPPEYLDPPPPYSRYPPSCPEPPPALPSAGDSRVHSASEARRGRQMIPTYRPSDYAHQTSHLVTRTADDLTTMDAPQQPSPVSPLNSLDLQYLTVRQSNPKVTIDSLLAHPMLKKSE